MSYQEYLQEQAIKILDDSSFYLNEDCSLPPEDEEILDGEDWEWRHGASKVAIILKDCALKVSLVGYITKPYGRATVNACNIFFHKNDIDYTEVEFLLYKLAKQEGVSKFFAKTEHINCTKVYKQERCLSSLDDWDNYLSNDYPDLIVEQIEKKEVDVMEYCSKVGLCPLIFRVGGYSVMKYLLAQYTTEELLKLQDFVLRYDINDIDERNIGITVNGRLKFFDFCGYKTSTGKKVLGKVRGE